jgi:acetylornithine deacetylase
MTQNLKTQALTLLQNLIATPSLSREEDKTADLIEAFFSSQSIPTNRKKNNVWAKNKYFDGAKSTILLNSHHDTVKPNDSWTLDPFVPTEKDGKLYGLGSNDAGAALVSLMATFCCFYDNPNLKYNLILAATAEEEISGQDGIELILNDLPLIDFAIVGEPTEMQMAIAEKGLLVLDCTAHGKAGHAARNEGENAIYKALADIRWFQTYQFAKISDTLGPIKMSVTVINAGTQHNVVPDICTFTVDVRVTEQYSLKEIIEIIHQNTQSEIVPRSVRLKPSGIDHDHPIVQAGLALGRSTYGSPTLSDQALLYCPSLKIGPGKSERSHTADEFIYLDELNEGIDLYVQLLKKIV